MILSSTNIADLRARRLATLPSELRDDWNRLAGNVPCRRWEWLEPWWRHYAARNDELFVIEVRDWQGELLGIAPWYLNRSIRHGGVIRFLGSGDVCSDYLTILAAAEVREAVVEQITSYLTDEAADQWDLIELTGVDAQDKSAALLVEQLAARDHVVHQQRGESCWRLDLPANWESYLKMLSKTRRGRIRQIVRGTFETGRAVSQEVTDEGNLSHFFQVLVELHQKRRESLGDPGCFSDGRFTDYHREVMERFFALGQLRLQYVLLDGRPVAIEYGLVGGNTVYFYQSGIEPAVLDQRPGWMGTIGSLRAAIDQGYQRFDFMRGDEAYKSSWGAQPVPTVETRIVAPRSAAQFRHIAWLAHQQMRRWAKARWRQWRGAAGDEN